LALIGPANGARPKRAKARPVKNQLSEAEIGVNFTAEKAVARGPRKVGRATGQSIGSTVGGQRLMLQRAEDLVRAQAGGARDASRGADLNPNCSGTKVASNRLLG